MEKVVFRTRYIALLIIVFFSCSCHGQLENNKPLTKTIIESLAVNNHLSVKERIALYHKLKEEGASLVNLEDDLNLYGYQLMWDGKTEEALEFFKLLVAEFPKSSNPYDSLAETYLKLGDKENALVNYQKSFDMDPSNYNAEEQIDRIKNPNKKRLSPSDYFSLTYSKMQYESDLDHLGMTLSEIHPNVYKFISKEAFWKAIEEKKTLVTDATTYAEFEWHCNEIIANVNCAHTSMGRFDRLFQMLPKQLRFPLYTRLIDARLYVLDTLNTIGQIQIKEEITHINAVPIDSIIHDIYKRIPSQGYIETTKRHEFNRWAVGMIPYALGFPQEYKVTLSDGRQVELEKVIRSTQMTRDGSIKRCENNLCLDFLDSEEKIATLTISSFNYYRQRNYKEFEMFIDRSMKEIMDSEVDHLIIDLRFNGGGSPESSMHLLKYLIHEPFIYYSRAEFEGKQGAREGEELQIPHKDRYNGKLYFIIDGIGNSTTGHFMSIVKDRNMGVIVGEELGSNQFCSAGQKISRMPTTKIEYYIADNTHVSSAVSLPDEVGVLPDYYITQSIDEYLDKVDAVKRFTIRLIDDKAAYSNVLDPHSTYFLEADASWRKELFDIPLHFAVNMTLKGIEDIRFSEGWGDVDSPDFWSYVFAWNLEQEKKVSVNELENNLKIYFDGLMNMEKRTTEDGVTKSQVDITQIDHKMEVSYYTGRIKTFNGFFSKIPLTLNLKAEQFFCPSIKRSIIRFEVSHQGYDHETWNRLREVKLPVEVCK